MSTGCTMGRGSTTGRGSTMGVDSKILQEQAAAAAEVEAADVDDEKDRSMTYGFAVGKKRI